ncbi:ABC transporter ATP-binding protein [Actinocatenispora comari]|uniref:ABC transporter ATP-binding protein n=1 Tax=Actinocatenispora comari TaxID=2807577 RepID=A0A8J4AEX8_9ACTN|nr:ABC transporter ATP-binding protein [Actinocatenispora comari]GIL27408.1 ABC transporter ATP-binding protein [Actinocatenispora comari]
MNIIEASGLGRRYRRVWALRDCTLAIPAGHVVALVGPSGSGKTTLLELAVGLRVPSAGRLSVLGGVAPGSIPALSRVAFVAQDAPLYRQLSVADTLRLAGHLNDRWDHQWARQRVAELAVPFSAKLGALSSGTQAQLALTVALGRRPELLILDEPLARLDPLARHEFLAAVLEAVATDGLSVVFSSHLLAELDRVADYLVVLSEGHVQVAGEIDSLVAGHRMLVGRTDHVDLLPAGLSIVSAQRADQQTRLLARCGDDPRPAAAAGFRAEPVGVEELVLAYLRQPDATALPGPSGTTGSREVPA